MIIASTQTLKVEWYPKMDQTFCFNMVKKDQLCAITLTKRNKNLKVFLKMVAMETNHSLLRYCFTALTPTLPALYKTRFECQISISRKVLCNEPKF